MALFLTSKCNNVASRDKRLKTLLSETRAASQTVIDRDAELTTMLHRNQDSLTAGIQRMAPFVRLMTNTLGSGHWFDGYICGLVLPSISAANPGGCNPR
ncbi:hypothetical protein [Amycolatopsis japonica]|uniref:hypothetical protein n=1 Tax=Amycolatopsis japonica TaxID=208439 RepID=UPI003F4D4823